MSERFCIKVNGEDREIEAPPMKRMLDVLRDDLGLTSVKLGCGEGECGACSVLVDGQLVMSCLVPLAQAAGAAIETVESLAVDGQLSHLQAAFLECGGAQCGICTPGMLMAAHAHLQSGGATDDASLREALAGNLCRCTGYVKILAAVRRAGEQRGAER